MSLIQKKKIINTLENFEKILSNQLPKWKIQEGEPMPIWVRLENFNDERDDSVDLRRSILLIPFIWIMGIVTLIVGMTTECDHSRIGEVFLFWMLASMTTVGFIPTWWKLICHRLWIFIRYIRRKLEA